MWLVGGDWASGCICEGGLLAVAAGVDVVVVEMLVVAGAEQDEVVEFGGAAVLDRYDVMRFELAGGAVQPGYWQCPERLCSARCWA